MGNTENTSNTDNMSHTENTRNTKNTNNTDNTKELPAAVDIQATMTLFPHAPMKRQTVRLVGSSSLADAGPVGVVRGAFYKKGCE